MSDSEDKIDQHRDAALSMLISTIDAAGGLITNETGYLVPKGNTDSKWTDLATAYLDACKATGTLPLIDGKRRRPCPIKSIDINLTRSVREESDDEETRAVHALAETFPEEIALVRVYDCHGVFLYYADEREGE